MRTRRVGTVLMVALLSGSLLGCASTDEQRTRTEGAAAGAVLGGLLGYAVDRQRGAAIGALIGGGAGLVVGNEIAKRKQAYASTEDFLDGEIARVDEFNRTATAYNSRLRQDIARLDQEAEQLRSQFAAGQVRRDSLAGKRDELQRQLATSRELEETLAEELKIQQAILEQEAPARPPNDPYIARLEREVELLEANLATLRDGSEQLARIDQRLSV